VPDGAVGVEASEEGVSIVFAKKHSELSSDLLHLQADQLTVVVAREP
jgi:hypothetical protein